LPAPLPAEPPAPAGIEARGWQEAYAAQSFAWFACRARPWRGAQRLAWGELQCDWHMRHGTRFPSWQCAGCMQPIGGFAAIDMPDGSRVHREPIDCAIAFGKRWREAADGALAGFGLVAPAPSDASWDAAALVAGVHR
jgi:hypothetical protein